MQRKRRRIGHVCKPESMRHMLTTLAPTDVDELFVRLLRIGDPSRSPFVTCHQGWVFHWFGAVDLFRHGSKELDSSLPPAGSGPTECCQPNGVIIPIGTPAAPPPDEWCRPNRGRCVLHPVGTRGAVGWMRGPGACPGGEETGWPHRTQTTRHASRTSTRPPPVSTSTPCPYRTAADLPNHSPIRLAKIIRVTVQTVKHVSSH